MICPDGNWQASFTHDGQGLELHRYYSGGLRTSWQRDALGRPVEQRIGPGGRPSASAARNGERVRTYGWQENDRLSSIDDSTLGATRYAHDAVGNLAATLFADGLEQLRTPDAVGNLFHTAGRTDRRYGPAGQLLEAQGTRYAYDEAGNLKQRTLPTGEQWHYTWNAAGHLSEVVRPDGGVVRFTYDALGRRISKSYRGRITRWVWDGNQPLHEWTELELNGHNTDDVITWLFEPDSFAPLAKLQGQQRQSIVCDHLGTPLEMHDERGQLSWAAELDSYGAVRKQRGEAGACPFRYQGQYEDQETGLYYNRFRYYDPEAGQYVSQGPIGLRGGMPNMYAYVSNLIFEIDPLGLSSHPGSILNFTDKAGTTLQVNGYTNLSHLNDAQLKSLYYANSGSGWGLSPKDAKGNTIVLHHYRQNPAGPIVAMPAQHHDKPHTNPGQHPYGKTKGGGLTAEERKSSDNWRKDYHADLAKTEMDKRGIKTKCPGK